MARPEQEDPLAIAHSQNPGLGKGLLPEASRNKHTCSSHPMICRPRQLPDQNMHILHVCMIVSIFGVLVKGMVTLTGR